MEPTNTDITTSNSSHHATSYRPDAIISTVKGIQNASSEPYGQVKKETTSLSKDMIRLSVFGKGAIANKHLDCVMPALLVWCAYLFGMEDQAGKACSLMQTMFHTPLPPLSLASFFYPEKDTSHIRDQIKRDLETLATGEKVMVLLWADDSRLLAY